MKEIILIKNGELALKGLNRNTFEDALVKNLKRRLAPVMNFDITRSQSTIMIEPTSEYPDMDAAADVVSRVFGIAGFSRAAQTEKDMDKIKETADAFLDES